MRQVCSVCLGKQYMVAHQGDGGKVDADGEIGEGHQICSDAACSIKSGVLMKQTFD